jgi:hypothetical protein
LKSLCNPDPSKIIELQDLRREMIAERADFVSSMIDLAKDPENFEKAYNHQGTNEKNQWHHEISKEFEEMKAKGIWEKFNKSEIPNG